MGEAGSAQRPLPLHSATQTNPLSQDTLVGRRPSGRCAPALLPGAPRSPVAPAASNPFPVHTLCEPFLPQAALFRLFPEEMGVSYIPRPGPARRPGGAGSKVSLKPWAPQSITGAGPPCPGC